MTLEERQADETRRALARGGRSHASAPCESSHPSVERSRGTTIDSIQYLRAIAAWLVVAYHLSASLESQLGWQHSFAIGAIGVDIFFVISGYIMAMIASRTVRFSAAEFLLRRFVRIAPLYWMVTIVFCLLCFLVPAVVNSPDVTPSQLVSSLFFFPDVMTGTPSPVLIIGWTLNYEFFFYAIVACSVWFTGDRTLLTAALTLCGCVIIGLLLDGNAIFEFYTQPIIMEFVLGILIWNYGSLVTDHRWFVPAWCVCLPVIVCALVVSGIDDDNGRFLMWGVPAAVFVLGAIPLMKMRIPLLSRLGEWSFATYLLHVYVIQFFVKFVAGRTLGSPALLVLGVAIAFLIIAVVSAIQFSWFEKQVTGWFNDRLDRWWPKAV